MNISIKINKLPKTNEEKDMFYLKIKSYKQEVEGKFERSELRNLIEKIDNAI